MTDERARATSHRDRSEARASLRDAAPAALALVVVEGLVATQDLDARAEPWQLAVALLPVVPAVWLGWAMLRTLRRCDEYRRVLHLEAMATGFAVALLLALVGGLVASASIGSSTQWLQLTFIGGVLAWVGMLSRRLR